MDQDILQKLPNEKLPELKHILKQNYPKNIHAYNLINTTIEIQKTRPSDNYITIYVPDGDISDATFVAIIEILCYDVFIYTEDISLTRLTKTLRETNVIKWEKGPLVCAMNVTFLDMVKQVKPEVGMLCVPRTVPSLVLYLSKVKALQFEYSIPDNMFIAPLNETHAKIMNGVWPHKRPGSEKYIAKILELHGGIGLFSKTDNELCAWVLKNYFGGLGLVQTADKHKRKGYGTLIVKIFSKMLAEIDGVDILGFVVQKNVASRTMFSKLEFEELLPVTWLQNQL